MQRECRWSWQSFQCVPDPPPPPPSFLDEVKAAVERPEILAALAALFVLVLYASTRRRALSRPRLIEMLQRVELLKALGEPELLAAVEELEELRFAAGDVVYRQANVTLSEWIEVLQLPKSTEDISLRPGHAEKKPTDVKFAVTVTKIRYIDTKRSSVNLRMFVALTWHTPLMTRS